jgi:hypothetical protein
MCTLAPAHELDVRLLLLMQKMLMHLLAARDGRPLQAAAARR